jgi:riboflavin synthase
MFTGIIQHVGKGHFNGLKLIIENPWKNLRNSSQSISIGESIAVNGVCLTVVNVDENLYFDVGEETLKRTNLSKERYFNLERALKIGDSLSGHYITGHIDGMITLISRKDLRNSVIMKFKKPREEWAIVEKGSVAINGVSLTIASVSDESFTVQVIPHSLENTNLKYLLPGSCVNYEIDVFARYVKGVLNAWKKEFYEILDKIS